MCSALRITLLPNAGCVMDTWSTCPCRRPMHTERPTNVSVPSEIGTKHGLFGNLEHPETAWGKFSDVGAREAAFGNDRFGSFTSFWLSTGYFRSTPMGRHSRCPTGCPKRAMSRNASGSVTGRFAPSARQTASSSENSTLACRSERTRPTHRTVRLPCLSSTESTVSRETPFR